jgi:hypothetical protein
MGKGYGKHCTNFLATARSVQSFVRFIYRIANLVGHSQLVMAFGFRTRVAHGALYDPYPVPLRLAECKKRVGGCKSETPAGPLVSMLFSKRSSPSRSAGLAEPGSG